MLSDLRDRTSICDMVARKRMHSSASLGVGISGTSINKYAKTHAARTASRVGHANRR
jgi:hypothetical protein